jgi:amidohydrolase
MARIFYGNDTEGKRMELNNLQNKLVGAIDAQADAIVSVSHQIHDHPELGYQEVFASGLLADTLERCGFAVERGYASIPTAFRARKGNPRGPHVAFLAEYDALSGIGHACGHNMICSAALAAGIGLGAVIDLLPGEAIGEVSVIGTPAEETDGGKVVMVDRGAFRDLDAALMVHPLDDNYYLAESLAMDSWEVEFFGKSAHAAAAPWDGKNALDALILTFTNVNALRQQIHPDARIHGVIMEGGVVPNIIPEHTRARFHVRARQRQYLDELVDRFKACVQAAALASSTRFELHKYEYSMDNMLNNIQLAERMRDYFVQALGSKPFKRSPDHFGSSDIGNVSHVVPAVHVFVAIADREPLSPHTTEFQVAAATPFADAAILRSGKALALTACDVLVDPQFLRAIKTEFAANRG